MLRTISLYNNEFQKRQRQESMIILTGPIPQTDIQTTRQGQTNFLG